VDYLGAGLLVAGVTCLLLVAVWGGNTYPWRSGVIVTLALAGVLLMGLFLAQERRAAEPILPLRLFRDSIFFVGSGTSLLLGAALFGAIVFLPLFLQVVLGLSATNSGLLLLPLMAGLVATSILSGRVISRTGRYRVWPITGMAIAVVGMYLLSRMDLDTDRLESSIAMIVLGVGIGMVMQVLVLAVQNSVEHRDLGAATSALNFFRSIGGTFGVAIYGAIFSARLTDELAARLPGQAGGLDPSTLANSPAAIRQLPPDVAEKVVAAIAAAVHTVFVAAVPLAVIGFVLTWVLREIPLKETAHVGAGLTESAPAPPPSEEAVAVESS
jgi:predicted MFS family arabinose efflux permease